MNADGQQQTREREAIAFEERDRKQVKTHRVEAVVLKRHRALAVHEAALVPLAIVAEALIQSVRVCMCVCVCCVCVCVWLGWVIG